PVMDLISIFIAEGVMASFPPVVYVLDPGPGEASLHVAEPVRRLGIEREPGLDPGRYPWLRRPILGAGGEGIRRVVHHAPQAGSAAAVCGHADRYEDRLALPYRSVQAAAGAPGGHPVEIRIRRQAQLAAGRRVVQPAAEER